MGYCDGVEIFATVFPKNRFVSLTWGVKVTQKNGMDLANGTDEPMAQDAVNFIK